MGAKQRSMLQSAVDVVGFLLLSVMYIVQSLVKLFLPKQLKSVEGEIILVTGGGGGLGRLVALRMARLKAILVLWDINMQGVDETVKLVEAVGGTAYGFQCDLCNREDVYKTAEKTRKEVGDVTILINNAGVASTRLLLDTPDHMIQRTFDVNILAHFWTTKAFLPSMIEKDHGHIVTIASLAGHVGIKKLVDYCSSKFAAVGFDESLRVELEALGAKGIRTTCVCPYFIQSTGMFDDVNSRFFNTLRPNDVADRIVEAIRANDLYVLMPLAFRFGPLLKWAFPWPCVSMFLRNLVPDAGGHGPAPVANKSPVKKEELTPTLITSALPTKGNSEMTINHRSAAVISERKP